MHPSLIFIAHCPKNTARCVDVISSLTLVALPRSNELFHFGLTAECDIIYIPRSAPGRGGRCDCLWREVVYRASLFVPTVQHYLI